MIIFVLEKDIAALDFEEYMPGLIDPEFNVRPFDEHFFACLARFFSENPQHQIASIPEVFMSGTDSVLHLYIQGHGAEGQIGVTSNLLDTKDLEIALDNLFETIPAANWPKQIFVDSCYAAAKPLMDISEDNIDEDSNALSVVNCVKGVLARHKADRGLNVEPDVMGCEGISIVHPNPRWPIVQVPEEHREKNELLQKWLETIYREEVDEAKRLLHDFKNDYSQQGVGNNEERLRLLKEVSRSVGNIMKPIFSEHVSLMHRLGFLDAKSFAFAANDMIAEHTLVSPPVLLEPQSEYLQKLKDMLKRGSYGFNLVNNGRDSEYNSTAFHSYELPSLSQNMAQDLDVRILRDLVKACLPNEDPVLPPPYILQERKSVPLQLIRGWKRENRKNKESMESSEFTHDEKKHFPEKQNVESSDPTSSSGFKI